ncbi:MAG TPA: hypothetical protein VNY73_03375 [Bacteroidia bacterium]|jgi:hypothetical protein|nr:hypothetical protein [Bacteroidia bacterium]
MQHNVTIHLLKGLNTLKFGAPATEALAIFGEPEEIEELLDELLSEKSTVYHYWNLGFSLFFKEDESKSFTCAEVDGDNTLLFDRKVFELNEKQIIDLFRENGFSLSETEQHAWGERRLSFDEAFADLYFERGKLSSINFCVADYPAGLKVNLN